MVLTYLTAKFKKNDCGYSPADNDLHLDVYISYIIRKYVTDRQNANTRSNYINTKIEFKFSKQLYVSDTLAIIVLTRSLSMWSRKFFRAIQGHAKTYGITHVT